MLRSCSTLISCLTKIFKSSQQGHFCNSDSMLMYHCHLLLAHSRGCNAGAGSYECCAALSQHAIMTLEIVTSRRSNMLYKPDKVKDTQEQYRLQVHPTGSIIEWPFHVPAHLRV